MGRVEFRRLSPSIQAPGLCLHGGQEGLGWRRRRGRVRHWVRGGGPSDCVARRSLGGAGVRVACPLPTLWPLAEAAVDSAGGIVAAAERGRSGQLRCG